MTGFWGGFIMGGIVGVGGLIFFLSWLAWAAFKPQPNRNRRAGDRLP